MNLKMMPVPGQPVLIYDLTEFVDILRPFCDALLQDNGRQYTLRFDKEVNKLNIWDADNTVIKTVENIMDTVVLDFLDTTHPRFKGKGYNYYLEKDTWLNDKNSWQGQRIHRHIQPFLDPDEIGDVTTVFYPYVDESINVNNGCFEIYEPLKEHPLAHVWLPFNLTPIYQYVPKQYHMIVMASEVWHRAKPFTGERYSLATDVRAFTEDEWYATHTV